MCYCINLNEYKDNTSPIFTVEYILDFSLHSNVHNYLQSFSDQWSHSCLITINVTSYLTMSPTPSCTSHVSISRLYELIILNNFWDQLRHIVCCIWIQVLCMTIALTFTCMCTMPLATAGQDLVCSSQTVLLLCVTFAKFSGMSIMFIAICVCWSGFWRRVFDFILYCWIGFITCGFTVLEL